MSDHDGTSFGLPSAEQLKSDRIWDSYFLPSYRDFEGDMKRSQRAIEIGNIEKLCYFAHVGIGTTTDAAFEKSRRETPDLISAPLKRWPEKLLGMIHLNANDVSASLDALNHWIRDGQMLGVYFAGGGPGSLPCTHKNFNPLIERIAELKAVIMQHTWHVTGGKTSPGHSLPSELAELAARFPEQQFICAHAGGEWEKGICAVRDSPNILVETSGFDATAGFIEMAMRELGPERIVFGSHLPSRSLGTELGKIVGANIPDEARKLILGGNFRRLLRRE
ncbi:amidohydrolase family protein [Verrucomicrobiales bacterium]|nr:amidohydrolase family protein [Verrucomicrobiales bacterium]MDC0322856.1 amidohydrolase family protein [Verrucomicrobiales bacterium]